MTSSYKHHRMILGSFFAVILFSGSVPLNYSAGAVEPGDNSNSASEIRTATGSDAPGCEETADGCYLPGIATVGVGDTIIMSNTDTAAHTYTSGTPQDGPDGIFDSGLLMSRGSFEWSPDAPGNYPYFCMVHPWAHGMIVVEFKDAESHNHKLDVFPAALTHVDSLDYDFTVLFLDAKNVSGTINLKLYSDDDVLMDSLAFEHGNDNKDTTIPWVLPFYIKDGVYSILAQDSTYTYSVEFGIVDGKIVAGNNNDDNGFGDIQLHVSELSLDGNIVTINGNIAGFDSAIHNGTALTFTIQTSSGNDLVRVGQIMPEDDGSFVHEFAAGGPLWGYDGDYFAEFHFDDTMAYATIEYVSEKTSSVSVSTDKESYRSGDTVNVSGIAANTESNMAVIIVKNPAGNVMSINQQPISDGNVISYSFVVGGVLYGEPGEYSVDVSAGNTHGTAKFFYSHDGSADINSADIVIRQDETFCAEKDSCFDPDTLEVTQGYAVTWYNDDDSHHNVVSGIPENPTTLFDSGLILPGESFEIVFDGIGEYDYFDMINPWIQGKVIVTSGVEINATNSTAGTVSLITNSTEILQNYFDSLNATKTVPSNNTNITFAGSIEIGKNVQWTQTIILNQTSDAVAIEIPDDAVDVIVTSNGTTTSQSDVDIIPSEQAESIIQQKTNSDGMDTIPINNKESVLVPLDDVIPVEEDKDTKLVVVEDAEEIVVAYETPAPYTIEKETDGDDTYEKKVKVKSDSAIHYSNVRSYSAIPEEYVLQGIPFELDWLINGIRVNVIDDERFDVQFEDTDGNGLVDTMSWIVPQLSEKIFSINADTAEADEIDDVPSKLELMQQKLDGPFYGKTLEMVNAKVMGELDEYLIQDRELDEEDIQVTDDFEYYSIVIVVPNTDYSGLDRKVISDQNKDELVKILQQYNAKNIYKAENLSFVTAQIPVSEISKLSDLGVVFGIGDGEINTVPTVYQYDFDDPTHSDVFEMFQLKEIVNAKNLTYDGTDMIVSILDKHETITTNHDDLSDSILYRLICQPDESILNNADDKDVIVDCVNVSTAFGWHPTHAAGIITGQGNLDSRMEGIATDAQIISIRKNVQLFSPFFLEGIDKSLRLGSDIVTVVFHMGGCSDDYRMIELILDESVDEGLILISGAGNSGRVGLQNCGYNTIGVGGIDPQSYLDNEDDITATKSSKGPSGKGMLKPELVAPSQNMWVLTGDNDYAERDGTSLAAPFVSAASAILKEANPYYTSLEIKSSLLLGAKWDPTDSIDLDSRTNKALTASNYELVATSTTNIISTTLNSYGFGLLDVEQSLAYTPRLGTDSSQSLNEIHIIRDTVSEGETETYNIVVEPEHIGEIQKIILSWLSQPRFTTQLTEVPISNLDFVLRDPQNNIVATSDSENQNNEFVVFIPQTDGTHTVQVTGTDVNTTFIQNERFTLASTIPISVGSTNSKPAIPSDAFEKPGVIRSCSSLGQSCENDYHPVDIYLSGEDQDGDILSFYIKTEPQHGTLSIVLKDTRTSGRVIYQPDSDFPENPATDYFEFGVYDGKSISATKRVEIIQHHIVPESDIRTGESEPDDTTTKTLGQSRYQKTTTFDSPAAESSGLWVLSSVSGSLFFSASPESAVAINTNEATLIDFADDQSLSGISFAAQDTYDSDYVKIGFVPSGDAPTTNYPPVARITISPDGIVDELTTVTLDGTASTDHETDTDNLAYRWQIRGNSAISPVTLSSADESVVTFRAPSYETHPTQEYITIDLTVTDEGGLSHTASTTIRVNSIPDNTDNPIARNDAYRVPSDSDSYSLDVLDNDHPDRSSLTIHSIGTTGTAGTPTISSDQKSIKYIPCTDCTTDSFTYTVSDGVNTSTAGLVSITVGDDYTLYVTSRSSQEIKQYDSAGAYIDDTLEWSRDYPTSMAFGGGDSNDDYMYVALNNDELHRYDAHTGIPYGDNGNTSDSKVWQFGDDINMLETGPDGYLYASTDGGKIYRFDVRENSAYLSWVDEIFDSSLDNPVGMTFDGTERLYVADMDEETIYHYDSSGTRSTFISSGSGGMEKPYDIAFDSMGNLFVSSEDEEEIYRFTPDGTPYRFSGDSSSALFSDEDLDSPRGITITPDDRILVANEQDDNIVEFNPYDGSPTHMPEPEIFTTGDGLDAPHDIVVGAAMAQNNSPSIDHISDKAVFENGSLTVGIVATDPDGDDSIVLSLPTKPSFATLQDNGDGTGTITFTPDYEQSGTYSVTVAASDGQTSDSESFSVVVYDVNRAPVLEDPANANLSVDAGTSAQIEITAADPDSNGLSFEITQQNSPSSFVALQDNGDGTANLTISPDSDQTSAVHFVTVRVTDDGNPELYDEVLFTITANVTVTCGIDIPSGVSFGRVDPGEISAEQTITISNTGNTAGTISVSSAPWVDGTDTTQMASGSTRVATVSGTYDSKVPLSESAENLGAIPEQGEVDLFMQLKADLVDSLFSGDLSQDMEVSLVC